MPGASNCTHEEHIAAGLKASINNPNVSDEAKQRASQRLKDAGVAMQSRQVSTHQGKGPNETDAHDHHVIGGLKATLKNPRVSQEAKESARQKLHEFGAFE
ncbi:hypothetical protein D9619_004153 [Psilocybe cf. subviscida]|uniref:Conidiation-specific protein 6 n=1 Tax=Psilocybe cf. subviscida TaxID=2480587 RepID=A0A8H5F8P7_9AGAR|nr:hypothetical protein D9619_004153 [Psilocybe cf. subviscida]